MCIDNRACVNGSQLQSSHPFLTNSFDELEANIFLIKYIKYARFALKSDKRWYVLKYVMSHLMKQTTGTVYWRQIIAWTPFTADLERVCL